MAVVIILAALDVVAGWSYLTSYFGYFGIPIEALDLSPGEILAHGVSSMLLTLTVIAAAFLAAAPGNKLGSAVALIGGYIVFLAFVAFVGHLASVVAILAQSAAAIAMAAVVFALRRGFGATAVQRLALAAVGLLLLVSLPIAVGTLDASQKASDRQSTLRIITVDPVLPGSAVTGGQFTYSNYILLRESASQYWLLRIDNRRTYSIAKTEVLYVRY